VDVTHSVPPYNWRRGAFLLWAAVEVCPSHSIHIAVIDPGVGSSRRGIAIRCRRGDVFVGPDNGILIPAVERLGGASLIVELTKSQYWRPSASNTFHGRDIFGPVAAHLANGVPVEQLGTEIHDPERFSFPEPRGLVGEVIHIDTYGDLVTNLPASSLPPRFQVHIRDRVVHEAAYYAAADPDTPLALVGSYGLLEVAVNGESAAALLKAQVGTPVEVEPV
jgi:S-adenosylmethionine hydrolase